MAVVIIVTLCCDELDVQLFGAHADGAVRRRLRLRGRASFRRARACRSSRTLELKDYCDAQQKEVNTYGWVDQRLHVVRHPDRPGHGPGAEERLARARHPARRGLRLCTVPPATVRWAGRICRGRAGIWLPSDGNAAG